MPLHIFEPRYRSMVERCLELDARFGLVYHDPDLMGPFLTEPGRVGCVAEIESHEPLMEGRSLILCRGVRRFRIDDGLESVEPFYEAVVEPYCDVETEPRPELRAIRAHSLDLFRAAVEAMADDPERAPELDVDRELSFRLAAAVEIDSGWQQSLLELRDEIRRLERLDAVFQAAVKQGG